jgi:hypothetical protein
MALNGTAATGSQENRNFPTRLPFKREPRFFVDTLNLDCFDNSPHWVLKRQIFLL